MDDRIRQGRDPEWRLAFEGQLGADARARIRRAVRHGHSVADPARPPLQPGLPIGTSAPFGGTVFILLPIQVGIATIWLAWMLDPQRRVPVGFLWFWAAVWSVLVTVGPFVLWWRLRMARRAVEANDQVADQANDLPT
jgi:hypothetical protein